MKILVAEDDKVTLRLLTSWLRKWGNEVVACSDGLEAWKRLQEPVAPGLVILDWIMPGIAGVNICRRIRELNRRPYVYVILLTAKNRKEDILEGLEAGADDYITKPFDPHELKVRVRAGARIVKLQEELIAALDVADYRATHDGLTGLRNRVAILEIGSKEMERCRREGRSVTFAIADLDHFKQINDRHGHLAGDVVLREVARRMESSVRPYDSVGRYGGEEFVIVMPGCTREEGRAIAERLRRAIYAEPVDTPEGLIPVTVSIGIGAFHGEFGSDTATILRNADEALYTAKSNGRNRVEVYETQACAGPETLPENESERDESCPAIGPESIQTRNIMAMEAGGRV